MKKWFKSLNREQVQKLVFVGLLVLIFAAFFISLSVAKNSEVENPNDNIEQPNDDKKNNDDEKKPQEEPKTTEESMGLPIKGDFVVVRKFYDSSYTNENLELAVIQYGKKYYTSNGIALSTVDKKDTDVCSALSGEVTNVQESPIYGVVVTIKHNNDVYTEYSSLSKTTVKVGDTVKQGDVIGTSGICEFDSSLASHVFFKVIKSNKNYDPETAIGKTTLKIGE